MAPQKRSRIQDDEETSNLESENRNRKQPRTSGGRNSSVSGDEPENQSPGRRPSAQNSCSQYELIRDDGFKHLENPELDDRKAIQAFLKRRERIGDNHAANNAIIQEITCINFMCHSRLHVKLGPLINFVVGMNGSGKSAVLTAITLCLGGKASNTNRGANLKSLIKGNQEKAILIVKLKNEGYDAYRPEIYGPSIIVERHFSRSGGSQFKLKSSRGSLISSKKSDMEDIVEFYQLQVDNPMNILTQDKAKSFLHQSTPSEKYKFFAEGVQLEALNNDYSLIFDTCDAIEAKLEGSKDDLSELEKEANIARQKAEAARKHDGMRKTASILSKKYAWAQVVDQEIILDEKERIVTEIQQKIDDEECKVENYDQTYQKAEQLLENYKEAIHRLREAAVSIHEAEEAARLAHETASLDVKKANAEQAKIKSELAEAEKDVKKRMAEIEAEQKLIAEANGGSHARKQAEICEAEQKLNEIKASHRASVENLPQLDIRHEKAKVELHRIESLSRAKASEIQKVRGIIHELNEGRRDPMAGYDVKMSKLLKQVRQDREFLSMPVGPLGMYIKLKDAMWGDIIEAQLSAQLNGFIVTNTSDQQRMSGYLKSLNMANYCPVMIVGNSAPIDTTNNEPDPKFQTVLRVLDIENELVRRYLIINQAIEQTLLIKSREDALRIMFEGPKPSNTRQAYSLHDNQRRYGIFFGFTSRGSPFTSGIKPPKGQPRMQTDTLNKISFYKETLSQLETESKNFDRELKEVEKEVQLCFKEITNQRRETEKLKIATQRAESLLEKLRAQAEDLNPEDGRLDVLKKLLEDENDKVRLYGESYGNQVLEKERLLEISSEKRRELSAVMLRVKDHDHEMNKAETKIHNTDQARLASLREKNSAIETVDSLKQEKAVAEKKRDSAKTRVAEFNEGASKICPRVSLEVGENTEVLEKQLDRIKQILAVHRKRQGASDQEIFDAATKQQELYTQAKISRAGLERLLSLLKQSCLIRIQMFRRFQASISARSRINFQYLLSERDFRGALNIDHKRKKLDVHVEPEKTVATGKGRQTKTLSGGEKSFSSICLLLALWEAMGAPLRCLDEFDVFMDDVNRDVSTKMIISAARKAVGRQFILITPKALGAGVANGDKDVRIIKLLDPRDRGQQRLDEMIVSE
ncbi:Structural maintenance of chromosomes protein 6 [Golovinomyces cichoracearum]|uniref:Structural maintenance of chromosomes protein 6 n=1 Tax=Golovinomyces cichoracearum TaxID=62708 RepID=A0A420HMR5_9PEZI|nr:Structural maintenance of chromosomes protein 6 [Golovinomyces cichoracearum]